MFKWVGLGLTLAGVATAVIAGFTCESIPWIVIGGVIFGIGLFVMSKG